MDREELKLFRMNAFLNKLQNAKKTGGKKKDNHDDNEAIHYIRIELEEMVPNPSITRAYIQNQNYPPQYVFLRYLLENHKERKKMKSQSSFPLSDLVTPCMNRGLWLFKKNLIVHREMKIFIRLNRLQMTEILKYSPVPEVCLNPEKYIVKTDPIDFVRKINELRKINEIYNYIFNFWQHIPGYMLNRNAVYRLKSGQDVELVPSICFGISNTSTNASIKSKDTRRVSLNEVMDEERGNGEAENEIGKNEEEGKGEIDEKMEEEEVEEDNAMEIEEREKEDGESI